jgi:hypothetical protein
MKQDSADDVMKATEDLIDICALLEYSGVPYQVRRTRSYIWVDTEHWRFQFTAKGKLKGKDGAEGCIPRPRDHRK